MVKRDSPGDGDSVSFKWWLTTVQLLPSFCSLALVSWKRSPLVLIKLHAHYQLTSFLPKLDIFLSICLLSQLYPLSVLDKHSPSQQGYCIQLSDVCSAQRLQQSGQVELNSSMLCSQILIVAWNHWRRERLTLSTTGMCFPQLHKASLRLIVILLMRFDYRKRLPFRIETQRTTIYFFRHFCSWALDMWLRLGQWDTYTLDFDLGTGTIEISFCSSGEATSHSVEWQLPRQDPGLEVLVIRPPASRYPLVGQGFPYGSEE